MRIVASCRTCGTQYDVSGHKPGDSVHCRCGGLVAVLAPDVHDAQVVRCGSCGASRQGREDHCAYCKARFSLAAKGWSSMCPGCFCRLPLDAKFCVDCGLPIRVHDLHEHTTQRPCPRCKVKLNLREIDGLAIHECNGCGGLWLSVEAFEKVSAHKKVEGLDVALKGLSRKRGKAAFECSPDEQAKYVPCPVCSQLMNRRNYATISGVVIDTCREHGVWLDMNELNRILKFIQDNGLERAQEHERERERYSERERSKKKNKTKYAAGLSEGFLLPGNAAPSSSLLPGLFSSRKNDIVVDLLALAVKVVVRAVFK